MEIGIHMQHTRLRSVLKRLTVKYDRSYSMELFLFFVDVMIDDDAGRPPWVSLYDGLLGSRPLTAS